MKFLYITNSRIPTEKAHGLQIFKMCEALSIAGVDLELIVPSRKNSLADKNPFDFYQIKNNFSLKYLPTIDPTILLKFPAGIYFKTQSFLFRRALDKYLQNYKEKIIYTRDQNLLPLLLKKSNKVVWEAHDLPRKVHSYKYYWYKCYKIITISNGLKQALIEAGVPGDKIFVAPDAVDLNNFNINESKEELRKEFNLPLDKNLIFYTGHLYGWKGVHVLARAAKGLSENELVCFLGGTDNDIKNFQKEFSQAKNIKILGRVESFAVPRYLKAADVLVLPNSASRKISTHYTSPMKLFEYMAADKPIVASALPSIQEVLNDNNAVLVEPDSPEKLAAGIRKVITDQELSNAISAKALVDVQNYTWNQRAKNILTAIQYEI